MFFPSIRSFDTGFMFLKYHLGGDHLGSVDRSTIHVWKTRCCEIWMCNCIALCRGWCFLSTDCRAAILVFTDISLFSHMCWSYTCNANSDTWRLIPRRRNVLLRELLLVEYKNHRICNHIWGYWFDPEQDRFVEKWFHCIQGQDCAMRVNDIT